MYNLRYAYGFLVNMIFLYSIKNVVLSFNINSFKGYDINKLNIIIFCIFGTCVL